MHPKLTRENWESDILKINCYKLDKILSAIKNISPINVSKEALKAETCLTGVKKPILISARIPFAAKKMEQGLLDANYRLMECYHVYKKSLAEYNILHTDMEIGLYRPDDLGQLKKIAYSSFTFDRFHKEKQIDKHLADLSRAIWLENSCNDPKQYVIVARRGKEVTGFNAVKRGDPLAHTISLIAVKKSARGSGLGTALVLAAANHSFALGAKTLSVGSQEDNLPGIHIYKKCGFKLADKKLTFHKIITD